MPGHPPLPDDLVGAEATAIRAADTLHDAGKELAACDVLETALASMLVQSPVLPWRITSRLAGVYRALRRVEDEVRLLERFHDSQTDEAMQTRFHARLSKARAVAGRQGGSRSSALTTLRDHRYDQPRTSADFVNESRQDNRERE